MKKITLFSNGSTLGNREASAYSAILRLENKERCDMLVIDVIKRIKDSL